MGLEKGIYIVKSWGSVDIMSKHKFEYDTSYTQNRELSWLKFNKRVLKEGEDNSVPLLERLKFVSIFVSNMDEFFMIRVGSLNDLSLLKKETYDNKTGETPKEQLDEVYNAVKPLYEEKDKAFWEIEKKLREHDIYNLSMDELKSDELKFVENYFKQNIMPLLSPQIIDSHHPFPHLWNKSIYVACDLCNKDDQSYTGITAVPYSVPKFLVLPGDSLKYVLMEKIIFFYSKHIFEKYTVKYKCIITVTRNADLNLEDEAFDFDENFRSQMKHILKKRPRLAPVRLEVEGALNESLYNFLLKKLDITNAQVYYSNSPLVLDYVYKLEDKLRLSEKRSLSYIKFEPRYPASLNHSESIIRQCKRKDILMFYPYEQMEPFIQLLKESAMSKSVKSIKITLYRLASRSKIIEHLCEAAENGKDVSVIIELRARFDEKNNIEWAERLEESGCKVIYGFEDFKVHSKICLITSIEKDRVSYITQIGTGNYNEKTAKLYTDLSLITANQEIGTDAFNFFKNMSISNLDGVYQKLFVAPSSLQNNIEHLIDEEILKAKYNQDGRIIIKANSITERSLIDKLMEASQTGVKIDLIIRGICCIVPGIEGKTENITVTSIVGRFLEHPRIYCFGKGKNANIYISSADLMTRNVIRRVEIACPILDEDIKVRILHILNIMLKDNVKAHILKNDGTYVLKSNDDDFLLNSQEFFMKESIENEHEETYYDEKTGWFKNYVLRLLTKYLTK